MALEESRRDTVKFPKKKEVGASFAKNPQGSLGGWGRLEMEPPLRLWVFMCAWKTERVYHKASLPCWDEKLRAPERVKWHVVFVPCAPFFPFFKKKIRFVGPVKCLYPAENNLCQQHTALLDLVDALPSSATSAPKGESRKPPAAVKKADPWGGPPPSTATSDPWQSFGKSRAKGSFAALSHGALKAGQPLQVPEGLLPLCLGIVGKVRILGNILSLNLREMPSIPPPVLRFRETGLQLRRLAGFQH